MSETAEPQSPGITVELVPAPPPPRSPVAHLPAWSVLDRGMGLAALRALAVIAVYTDPVTGWADIPMRDLIAAMGHTRKTGLRFMPRLLSQLEAGGFLRSVRGSATRSGRYQVVMQMPPEADDPLPPDPAPTENDPEDLP